MAAARNDNFAGKLHERLGAGSCLADAATRLTWRADDLRHRISRCASGLRSSGLEAGDGLLIGCNLTPLTSLAYLSAIYAGLVAIPVEERLVKTSAPELIAKTGAKAIWTERQIGPENTDRLSTPFLYGDFSVVEQQGIAPVVRKEDDLAALMATSGSTGIPRFVKVTHGNLTANTEAIIRSQDLTSDDRALLVLPISYCFGASVLHTHLYQGGSVILDRRFMFPDQVLRAITEYECTNFAGVPTVFNTLLRRSNFRNLSFPTLKRFLQAGGALEPERIGEFREALPKVGFLVMYGQTEATARISCMRPDGWKERVGSVGQPLDNLSVRIVDENDRDVPNGQVGELWVKGPSVCLGYFRDPVETSRKFVNGWLRTEDFARQDNEGYLWIEGRKGAFLKTRGVRVSFKEVEAKIMAVQGIFECAALATSHPEAGEALVLHIVPDRGAKVDEAAVRRQLPAHWAIDSIRFVPELPRTSAGKIAFRR